MLIDWFVTDPKETKGNYKTKTNKTNFTKVFRFRLENGLANNKEERKVRNFINLLLTIIKHALLSYN